MTREPPQGGTDGFYRSAVITSESNITYAGDARILYCRTSINITLAEVIETPGRVIDIEGAGGNPTFHSETSSFRLADGSTQETFNVSSNNRDRTVFHDGAWLINQIP